MDPVRDPLMADQVAAFLRANPAFLANNPALYDHLTPPTRLHGPGLADHMHAMLHQARNRASSAEQLATQTANTRRAAEGFTRRVQETVLALMRAADPAWLAIHELASLLRIDAARLCAETHAPPSGIASIPPGTVAAALGQRPALTRPAVPDRLLHGEAMALAVHEALIRIPVRTGPTLLAPTLLALATRDPAALAGATTDALAFLGEAVAAALDAEPGRPEAA